MIEFGNTLRQAREAKGLSFDQLSEMTHIAIHHLKALENEMFEEFAAPIYIRGFIKLYCAKVGIAAEPLLEEFNEIQNGNREPSIRERPVSSPAESIPAVAEPEPTMEPATPTADEPPMRSSLFELREAPVQPSAPVQELPKPEPAVAEQSSTLSRYAAPIRTTAEHGLSAVWWRRVIVFAVLVAALWGVLAGLKALYRATTPVSDVPPAEAHVAEETPAPNAPRQAKKAPAERSIRTPQKIPSLYID